MGYRCNRQSTSFLHVAWYNFSERKNSSSCGRNNIQLVLMTSQIYIPPYKNKGRVEIVTLLVCKRQLATPEFMPIFSWVRVDQSLVFCVVFYRSMSWFFFTILLSVLLLLITLFDIFDQLQANIITPYPLHPFFFLWHSKFLLIVPFKCRLVTYYIYSLQTCSHHQYNWTNAGLCGVLLLYLFFANVFSSSI